MGEKTRQRREKKAKAPEVSVTYEVEELLYHLCSIRALCHAEGRCYWKLAVALEGQVA